MIEAKKAAEISYENSAEKHLSAEIEKLILRSANAGETYIYYTVPYNYSLIQVVRFLIKYGYSVSIQGKGCCKICWGATLNK